ncbi:MAG: HD-GYP domain-containing protein [bacterium]
MDERTREIGGKNKELFKLNEELKENFLNTIRAFAGLVELRDAYVGSHNKRVAAASLYVAERLRLPDDERLNIEISAMLHDIGKVGIPDSILHKDVDRLSEEELKVYRSHPVLGQASVQVVDGLRKVAQIIRAHHERYDGTGYPDGLSGDGIPLGARIIAVADFYDRGVNRKTSKSFSAREEVVQQLVGEKGQAFDPSVVDVFLEFIRASEARTKKLTERAISLEELKEGMVVSRDVYSSKGILLVSKDETLKRAHIEKIRNYHRTDPIAGEIYIYDQKVGEI